MVKEKKIKVKLSYLMHIEVRLKSEITCTLKITPVLKIKMTIGNNSKTFQCYI